MKIELPTTKESLSDEIRLQTLLLSSTNSKMKWKSKELQDAVSMGEIERTKTLNDEFSELLIKNDAQIQKLRELYEQFEKQFGINYDANQKNELDKFFEQLQD